MIFYIKCIKVQTLKYLQDGHVLNTFNVKVIGVLQCTPNYFESVFNTKLHRDNTIFVLSPGT